MTSEALLQLYFFKWLVPSPGSTTSESLGSGTRHEYVKNKQTLQMTYVLSHIVGRDPPLIYFTERVSEPNEVAWSLHLAYSGCYAINRVPPQICMLRS